MIFGYLERRSRKKKTGVLTLFVSLLTKQFSTNRETFVLDYPAQSGVTFAFPAVINL